MNIVKVSPAELANLYRRLWIEANPLRALISTDPPQERPAKQKANS